ncbi:MAG TPA: hypothetical protein VIC62_18830 [Nakamurella sp.]
MSARYLPLIVKVPRRPGADALTQGAADRRVLAAAHHAVSAARLTAIARSAGEIARTRHRLHRSIWAASANTC